MTTFRELYWSEDWLGVSGLFGSERQARFTELCIGDPDETTPEEDRKFADAASSRRRHTRLKRVREVYGDRGVSKQDWETVQRAFNDRCAYCGFVSILLKEHVVAIAKGGRDHWSNIVPACRQCNAEKLAYPLELWLMSKPESYRKIYEAGVKRRDILLGGAK